MTKPVSSSPSLLVAIVGPTASGKSALGMSLARRYGGEIICADSRTIYTGMDIGTAKPSPADRRLVPYHLLDVILPNERFSAADFQREASHIISDITRRGRLPIMVGGSGLYVDSVLFDYRFDLGLKQELILRPNTLVLGIRVERGEIRIRSARRLELMLQQGLVEEVRKLTANYPSKLPGLYYPIIARYLAGQLALEEAKDLCVQADINLAKRQLTWFRRNPYIKWLDAPEQAEQLVAEFLT